MCTAAVAAAVGDGSGGGVLRSEVACQQVNIVLSCEIYDGVYVCV